MLTDSELDELYSLTCRTMTALGNGKTELFLARLALLLMKEVGDAERVRKAVESAQGDPPI